MVNTRRKFDIRDEIYDSETWLVIKDGYGELEQLPVTGGWGITDISEMWFNEEGDLLFTDMGSGAVGKFDLDRLITTKRVKLEGTPPGPYACWYNAWYGLLVPYANKLAMFDDDLNLKWSITLESNEKVHGMDLGDDGGILTSVGDYTYRRRDPANGRVTDTFDLSSSKLATYGRTRNYVARGMCSRSVVRVWTYPGPCFYDSGYNDFIYILALPYEGISHPWRESYSTGYGAPTDKPAQNLIFNIVNKEIELFIPLNANHIAFDPVTRGNIICGTWKKGLWFIDRRKYKPRLTPWKYAIATNLGANGLARTKILLSPILVGYKGLKLYVYGNGAWEIRLGYAFRVSDVGTLAGDFPYEPHTGVDTIWQDSADGIYRSIIIDLTDFTPPTFTIQIWNRGTGTRELKAWIQAEV
jgi:hypothetical protein